MIDVCMGGRVAERMGKVLTLSVFSIYQIRCSAVYGPDNVTSGASSDIKQATRTATAMVKVSKLIFWLLPELTVCVSLCAELGVF
jgi:ATP-dependent metalloprotease